MNYIKPISNEIFETYTIRERADEQVKAIKILARQGYTVIDLEGNIIDKWNIENEIKPLLLKRRYSIRST
jgi:hypothetical protein